MDDESWTKCVEAHPILGGSSLARGVVHTMTMVPKDWVTYDEKLMHNAARIAKLMKVDLIGIKCRLESRLYNAGHIGATFITDACRAPDCTCVLCTTNSILRIVAEEVRNER